MVPARSSQSISLASSTFISYSLRENIKFRFQAHCCSRCQGSGNSRAAPGLYLSIRLILAWRAFAPRYTSRPLVILLVRISVLHSKKEPYSSLSEVQLPFTFPASHPNHPPQNHFPTPATHPCPHLPPSTC